MAKIIFTIKEFHRYIGPRIRNVVQSMTKKRKKELNHICQECKSVKELEAAHILGNSRKEIVERILKKYISNPNDNLVEVDLDNLEQEIVDSHRPIDEYFRFLCSKCHNIYDKGNKK